MKLMSFAVMVSQIPLLMNGNEQTRGSNSVVRDAVAIARPERQQYGSCCVFLGGGWEGGCMHEREDGWVDEQWGLW